MLKWTCSCPSVCSRTSATQVSSPTTKSKRGTGPAPGGQWPAPVSFGKCDQPHQREPLVTALSRHGSLYEQYCGLKGVVWRCRDPPSLRSIWLSHTGSSAVVRATDSPSACQRGRGAALATRERSRLANRFLAGTAPRPVSWERPGRTRAGRFLSGPRGARQ